MRKAKFGIFHPNIMIIVEKRFQNIDIRGGNEIEIDAWTLLKYEYAFP
jgi:hypothetical protein